MGPDAMMLATEILSRIDPSTPFDLGLLFLLWREVHSLRAEMATATAEAKAERELHAKSDEDRFAEHSARLAALEDS